MHNTYFFFGLCLACAKSEPATERTVELLLVLLLKSLRICSFLARRNSGTMERPALKRLLEDIKAGKVQIVVVHKVDRLTRSLADFAKIVDIVDAHNASFVSVTQQFNTTTSIVNSLAILTP
jgi:hypothetical protein